MPRPTRTFLGSLTGDCRRTSIGRRLARPVVALLLATGAGLAGASTAPQDLGSLTLEDLGNVVVSSVAKRPQALADAPAAVYVISHEDIVRSGATTLAGILRLAPNLEVFQTSPSDFVVASRGLSGNRTAQNFPNKLLVLIDGRSVYSPIFSGVYWDDQYVLPEDIERIEVVSGPGGALWGANAVNGVINIITREAGTGPEHLVHARVGTFENSLAVQFAGRLGARARYRFYVRDARREAFDDATGADAHDASTRPQAGLRVDVDMDNGDALLLEADVHAARTQQPAAMALKHQEGDLLARWQHALGNDSDLQVQTYYDRVRHWDQADGGSGFTLDTWDLQAQQDVAVGQRHHVVWGIGDRVYHYRITPRIGTASSLLWQPASRTQNLANAFAQDEIALARHLHLTLGLKAEKDPYSGLSLMPNARLAWKPTPDSLLWAAASRAVRTPTPFDRDVVEKLGSTVFLTGNPAFRREKLTAYEGGWRGQVATRATLSVSAFYDRYDDLRTIELSPTGLPLVWGNGMEGHGYGVELWGDYAVTDAWRLGAGMTLLHQHLRFKPGASGLLGVAQAGDDPSRHGFLRSSVNLSDRWTFDATLRGMGPLPDPHVPGYLELDARLAWRASDMLTLALTGTNLLHRWHQEYVFPGSDRIPRTIALDARLAF